MRIIEQRLPSAREAHPPLLEHIGAIRRLKRGERVLLDHDDRHPLRVGAHRFSRVTFEQWNTDLDHAEVEITNEQRVLNA